MKKFAAIAFVGWLLVVGSVWASQVTNVEIKYVQGCTVARIDVRGPVRYAHQTEVPKDGRPDRVIVDVLSATHELGAREFFNLPSCIVTGVRSSQYAVSPEKIVRIVFDLNSTPVYSVNSDDESITVTFTKKEAGSFATWSSSEAVNRSQTPSPKTMASQPAPVSAQSQATASTRNKNIEKDRMASLTPGDPESKAQADKKNPPPASSISSGRNYSGKAFSDEMDSPNWRWPAVPVVSSPAEPNPPTATVAQKPEIATPKPEPVQKATNKEPAKPAPSLAEKKVEKPVPAVSKPVEEPTASQPTLQVPFLPLQEPLQSLTSRSDKPAVSAEPKPIPSTERATVAIQAPPTKLVPTSGATMGKAVEISADEPGPTDEADYAPAVELPASVQPEALTKVAVVDDKPSSGDNDKQRATARFRREAQSDKIRGTMVAEFPQRLVIKYGVERQRDPFSPLVDQSRTYNDPVENRIPNVEGLKLVGVLESEGAPNRALFEDKAGFSYILKTGDKVSNGYVLRVEEDQVYFQIFEYGWSRTVALTMEY